MTTTSHNSTNWSLRHLRAATGAGLTTRVITEPAREVPVIGEYDVLVCGGGPAGLT